VAQRTRPTNRCADGCSLADQGDQQIGGGLRCETCGRAHLARDRPGVLRVLLWNKWHMVGAAKLLDHLARPRAAWDVALLLECRESDVRALSSAYGDEHVASVFDHEVDRARAKPHGPAVVVRHGLEIASHRLTFPWTAEGIEPKGDKSLTVEVDAPFGRCTFVATHVMNGGDGPGGWQRKLRTYERLDEELRPDFQPWPVVVGMDGNVWEDHLEPDPQPDHDCHAQRWFQSGWAAHGLQDTLRTAVVADPQRRAAAQERLDHYDGIVGTFQLSATVTRFDRIYASPDVVVLDAGVDPAGLDVSDHAIVWADLLFPATAQTHDPELLPNPRARKERRELELHDVAQYVVRADRYGWNRRGYLARVALASLTEAGYAGRDFINAHYPGDPAPHRQWNGARRSTNQSWASIGEGRFGEVLVHHHNGRHWMDAVHAQAIVDVLGIADLVEHVPADDLEARLARRLSSGSSEGA